MASRTFRLGEEFDNTNDFFEGPEVALKPTPEFHLLPISDGGGNEWLPGKFHNGVKARQGAGDHHQVDGDEDDDVMWCDGGGVNDDGDNHDSVQAAKGPGITLKLMKRKNLSKELYSLQVFFSLKVSGKKNKTNGIDAGDD